MNVLKSIQGLNPAYHFYLLVCSNCEQVKMIHPELKTEINYLALSSQLENYLNSPANVEIKTILSENLNLIEIEGRSYLGYSLTSDNLLFSNLNLPARLLNRFWYQCNLFKDYLANLHNSHNLSNLDAATKIKETVSKFLVDAYCFFNCKFSEITLKIPLKSLLNYFEKYVNSLEELCQMKPFNRKRTGRERGQMENLLKASNNIFWDVYALFEFFINRHNSNNLPNWQFYYINRDTFFRAPEFSNRETFDYFLKGSKSFKSGNLDLNPF